MTIETGSTAFATVRVEWPVAAKRCYIESMFGFGQLFRVQEPEAGAQCDANAVTRYAGISSKTGSAAFGKGDNPAEGRASVEYTEFDQLKVALAAGMVLHENENRRAADYNLPGQRVGSAAVCAAICARDSRCNAMTFITDQGMCWLKAERGNPIPAGGMISAVKPINPKAAIAPR